jgi:hypothetical protein
VLKLKPVLKEDRPDEPPSGDGEAALVEHHERDNVPLGGRNTDSSPGTFHSMVSVSGGSCPMAIRRCSIMRDMLERNLFDMATARVRESGESSSGAAGVRGERSGWRG